MKIPAASAANAYAAAAKTIANATKEQNAAALKGATDDEGFGTTLKQVVDGLSTSVQKAENTTMSHIGGKADIVDVVTAVAETEVAMRTLVNVRDRVIAAYQEILRMPI